jgi:RNA polymerase sigma-70 factor, ECF subfamily
MPLQPSTAAATVHSLLSFRETRERETSRHMRTGSGMQERTGEAQNAADAAPSSDTFDADAARCRELALLIEASARGDAQAFESFYERTIHFASAIARRVVGNSHVEDVLSEAYLQAWRDAGRFDASRGNALSWIVTIARSRALDRLRQENVRHAGMSGAPDTVEVDLEDEGAPGPDTLLEQVQAATALHAALAQLSANERWCVALSYYRELSHREIATLTGLPLGTVKSLINRAQQKLRELMTTAGATLASKATAGTKP